MYHCCSDLHWRGLFQAVDANQEVAFLVLLKGRGDNAVATGLHLETSHDLTGVDEGVWASFWGVAQEEILGQLLCLLAVFVLKLTRPNQINVFISLQEDQRKGNMLETNEKARKEVLV